MNQETRFETKSPKTEPLNYSSLTKEQFDEEIEKGMADIREGRVYAADAVEAEMKLESDVAARENRRKA